jgi:hypothetical protein
MSETKETTVEATMPNPFEEASWATSLEEASEAVVEEKKEAATETEVKVEETATVTTEVITPNPIKEKLGFESIDEVEAELKRLRETAQTPAEIKFANEQSQKLFDYLKEGKEDDVYSFLDSKRKLSGAANLKAAEAIRLHLEMTNKHFSAADVQDVFEERYAIPEKPTQSLDETDEEYAVREDKWKASVEKINRKIERDAVVAKQELAQLTSELVLPDIPKKAEVGQAVSEAQQKELERIENLRNLYLTHLESDYKGFKGYNVVYKDEEVEIPISYGITEQELVAQKEQLKTFDVDGFIGERWFTNGKPNVNQMQADVYLLLNKDRVFAKLANEAGQKRLAEHLKKNANVNINGSVASTGTFDPSKASKKDENVAMAEFYFQQ